MQVARAAQCVALNDPKTGSRKVAGTHWDFNSYGGELKKAMGIAPQARPAECPVPAQTLNGAKG